ncbi:MAG TPA: rubredoxin, partial [Bacillota bacterium]|nr:rubredoxin [Bacillota bacterium]
FSEVDDKETELIRRSRYTNDLHCRLIALMEQVEEIAEAGIDDDLDPGCVAVFKRAREEAWIIGQSAKAEIRAHIAKGKWS